MKSTIVCILTGLIFCFGGVFLQGITNLPVVFALFGYFVGVASIVTLYELDNKK